MDHTFLEGGSYHPQQQPVFLLEPDDHWPVHPGPPAPLAVPVHDPLPPLPSVGAGYPGKPAAPMVPVGLPDDDEATESEDDRRPVGMRGTVAMAWQPQPVSAGRRPESALTGASQQPSPTPSVSLRAAAPSPVPGASGSAPKAAAAKGGGKAPKARKPGGKGGISLRLLIEEGVLQPGHNVLSVDYKGIKQLATLMPDGRISSSIKGQTMVFESPSAFSIYLKRLVNPTRKADDGWKTVRYNNRVLEQFKAELIKRRQADGSSGAATPGIGTTFSEQQPTQHEWQQQEQQQQQPHPLKRARVDSGSDLTGGSVAVSATVKEGDRNVLKLKFARPKKTAEGAVAAGSGGQIAGGHPQELQQQMDQQTDYQRSRPRRQVQAPPRFAALGHDNEHALQPLEAYAPGSPGTPGCQPYTLYVSPVANVVMDAHAHMSSNEVIGILAGVFDPTTRTISILRAHPVRELATEDNSINVEMDPEDEWHVRRQIDAAGLRVVGWYHSHPTFPTQPSTIDIYNQVLQQHHHRDDCGAEPYVAAIVGPYDKRQQGPSSSITWFYVDHPPGALPSEGQRPEAVGCVAKALQTLQLMDSAGSSTQAEIAAMPESVLQQLAQRYAHKADAVNMAGSWRDGTSCAQKLIASLLSRLPALQWSPASLQDFSARLQDMVTATLVDKLPRPPSVEVGAGTAGSEPTGAVASTVDQVAAGAESEEEISDLSA